MSDYSFNKISVIGAGAMGAYYAGRFFEMGGMDVALNRTLLRLIQAIESKWESEQ